MKKPGFAPLKGQQIRAFLCFMACFAIRRIFYLSIENICTYAQIVNKMFITIVKTLLFLHIVWIEWENYVDNIFMNCG